MVRQAHHFLDRLQLVFHQVDEQAARQRLGRRDRQAAEVNHRSRRLRNGRNIGVLDQPFQDLRGDNIVYGNDLDVASQRNEQLRRARQRRYCCALCIARQPERS